MGSDWQKNKKQNKRKQEPIGLELNIYNNTLAGPWSYWEVLESKTDPVVTFVLCFLDPNLKLKMMLLQHKYSVID